MAPQDEIEELKQEEQELINEPGFSQGDAERQQEINERIEELQQQESVETVRGETLPDDEFGSAGLPESGGEEPDNPTPGQEVTQVTTDEEGNVVDKEQKAAMNVNTGDSAEQNQASRAGQNERQQDVTAGRDLDGPVDNGLIQELKRQRNTIDSGDAGFDLDNPPAPGPQTVSVPGTGNIPPAQISNEEYRPPEQTVVGSEYGSGTNLEGQNYFTQDQTTDDVTAESLIRGADDVMIDPGQAGQDTYQTVSGLNLPGEMEETYARGAGTVAAGGAQLFNTVPGLFQTSVAASQDPQGTASEIYEGSRRAGPNLEGLSENPGSEEYFESQAGVLNLVAGVGGSSLARRGTLRGVTTDESLTDIARNPVKPGDQAVTNDDVDINTIQSQPEKTNPELQKVLSGMDLEGTRGPAGSGRQMVVEGGTDRSAQKQDLLMSTVDTGDREVRIVGRTESFAEQTEDGSQGLVAAEGQAVTENNRVLDPDNQFSEKQVFDFETEEEFSSQDIMSGGGPTGDERIVRTEAGGSGTVGGEDFQFIGESTRASSPEGDADFIRTETVAGSEDTKSSVRTEGFVLNEDQINQPNRNIDAADSDASDSGDVDMDLEELQNQVDDLMEERRQDSGSDTDAEDSGDDFFDESEGSNGQDTLLVDEESTLDSSRAGVSDDAVNVKAFENLAEDAVRFEDTDAGAAAGGITAAGTSSLLGTTAAGDTSLAEEPGLDQEENLLGLEAQDQSQNQPPVEGQDSIVTPEEDTGLGLIEDTDTALGQEQTTTEGFTRIFNDNGAGRSPEGPDLFEEENDEQGGVFGNLMSDQEDFKFQSSVGAQLLGLESEDRPSRESAGNPFNLRPETD